MHTRELVQHALLQGTGIEANPTLLEESPLLPLAIDALDCVLGLAEADFLACAVQPDRLDLVFSIEGLDDTRRCLELFGRSTRRRGLRIKCGTERASAAGRCPRGTATSSTNDVGVVAAAKLMDVLAAEAAEEGG